MRLLTTRPHYLPSQVGFVLSAMGLGGIFVQGVLVRVVTTAVGEERTLLLAMVSTALGFSALSYAPPELDPNPNPNPAPAPAPAQTLALVPTSTLTLAPTSTLTPTLTLAPTRYVKTVYHLAPALALVSVGYGLAVPCLSTLFSNVPMEQGIMQAHTLTLTLTLTQSLGP